LAFSTFFSVFAPFAERRFTHNGAPFTIKEVGYVFAYSGFIGILIQGGGMGSLVKRFGESRLVQIGFILMAAGFGFLAEVHSIFLLMVAIGLLTFGSAILRPSLTTLITDRAPRHRQGMVIGIMQSLMSVAQIVAPIIAGLLIQQQFLSMWAAAGTLFCAIGWMFFTTMR
jgi:MFS transporter, DHA1 family, tetracycline resistance protein